MADQVSAWPDPGTWGQAGMPPDAGTQGQASVLDYIYGLTSCTDFRQDPAHGLTTSGSSGL